MSSTSYHICLDVEGVLNWPNKMLKNVLVDRETGRTLTPDENRRELARMLSDGIKVLPIDKCDSFSFETGCPGHAKEDEATA